MIKMSKNEITRVCIFTSVYSLLIYLLYSNDDELKKTFYFFTSGVTKSIREKFPGHFFINIINSKRKKKSYTIIKSIYLFFFIYLFRYLRWPFLRKADIFCNDHNLIPPFIIGKKEYAFIEEEPKILSIKREANSRFVKGLSQKILCNLISDVVGKPFANNKQCKSLVLTEDDDVPYIMDKKKYIMNLHRAWDKASERKRKYILNIYNIYTDDINILEAKTHILLVQPLSTDGTISEDEQISIYRQIIEKYDPSSLLIKSHPRDLIDYRKYFPNICIFDKPIPMQLLILISHNNFIKAITLFSSAIKFFPDTVEKEWIGSSVHPALFMLYPNMVHNIYK